MQKKLLSFILIGILSVYILSGCDDTWMYESEDAEVIEETENESIGIEPIEIGSDAQSATVMIYMNGSDLETKTGQATADLTEMVESGIGENVNVIVQTMGTRRWHGYGISSETSQIYRVKRGELELVKDNLGQLDCTKSETLAKFIDFGKKNYPADRYILIFWDHGGGPVYGFGLDEWQSDKESLTLDEIQEALHRNSDIRFDIIGMDCCIMANLETCYVLAPFCKYAVLSEDFESGLGWSYAEWMKIFEDYPGISTPLLGKKIIDGMIDANENDYEAGASSTMILVNERAVPDLVKKWTDYAYKNSDSLLGLNYSKLHMARGRGFMDIFFDSWEDDESYVTMDEYYVSDVLSIVESIGKDDEYTTNLRSSLKACVAYFGHTSDKNELTGLAVSLPYGNQSFYDQLVNVYSKCGFDEKYIDWLEGFVSAEGINDYCDYSSFEDSWCGWQTYEEGWGSCEPSEAPEDWEYDYEEKLWYFYEDGNAYLYDDESDMLFFYDEYDDELYLFDEEDDHWYVVEE